MRLIKVTALGLMACLLSSASLRSQESGVVPRLIKFSGELNLPVWQPSPGKEGESGRNPSLTTMVVSAFSLYEFQEGGSPLWSEQQKVQVDQQGRYSVLLGATQAEGLPLDLFTSGKALWLGVQPLSPGAAELPRVLLVAVPYALKAADSDTLGGKPASAYALAGPGAGGTPAPQGILTTPSSGTSVAEPASGQPQSDAATVKPRPQTAACASLTADQNSAASQVAVYSANCALSEDPNFVDVSGQVGIGTPTPSAPLTVVGTFGTATVNQTAIAVVSNWTPTANDPTYQALGGNFQATKLGTYSSTNGLAVRGAQTVAVNQGSGSVTGLAGLAAGVKNLATGTVTSGIAINAMTPTVSNADPIANSYGVYIGAQKVTGVTTGYGIFTAGATDINYFAGNIGIGTKTPTASLEVNGATKFDQAVTFAAGQTFTGDGSGLTGVNAATLSGNLASAFQRAGSYANPTNDNVSNQSDGVGALALANLTSGGQSVGIGMLALNQNTTGSFNNAIGTVALSSNTSGYKNNAMGWQALTSNTTGIHNTAVGHESLQGLSSGNDNTALGYRAGYGLSTGSNNTFIGSAANPGVDGLSNATAIGFEAQVSQSNSLVLGSTAAQNTSANTFVGIDVGTPGHIFTILQGGGHAIADGWDTYSSGRWKSNIHTLHGALGKVEQLRGVEYTYTANGRHDIGMIAEEVGKVVPEVVSYEANGKDAQGIDYARLTALLVEAVKQQQAEIKELRAEVKQLKRAEARPARHAAHKPKPTAKADQHLRGLQLGS